MRPTPPFVVPPAPTPLSSRTRRGGRDLLFALPVHPACPPLACHPDRSGRPPLPLANASAGRGAEGSWLDSSAGTVAGIISRLSRRSLPFRKSKPSPTGRATRPPLHAGVL